MSTVSFERMRLENRSAVLNVIRKYGPLSRTEIVGRTGLTLTAVSKIVSELQRSGLICDAGAANPNGGRKARLLRINSAARVAVGVNVGYSRICTVLTDLDGRILARHACVNRGLGSPQGVLDYVADTVHGLLAENGVSRDKIIAVGVGIPGLVDTRRGISVFSPNLNWHQVPVGEYLESRLGLPVIVDNDVRAATLGERWHGAGKGLRTLVGLFVGTGIGAGLVIDGKLHYGATESAGEIGHTVVVPGGPICSCGNRGCLEAVASGRAIADRAKVAVAAGAPGGEELLQIAGGRLENLTAEHVALAARQGNVLGRQLMEETGRFLGIGVSILCNVINPEAVVLGGGVSRSSDLFLGAVQDALETHTLEGRGRGVKVLVSQLGADAGPVGAATLVLQKMFSAEGLAQEAAGQG
ncbi:MAG: ROK family transcriptional regulator [Firmicutes bacterium]|nr:ROK family transcriptional regulator [Bacillota bacterium]